ncbi:MAG: GDP-mannose 4,6-dehydratase [Chloroflexi bacterium]|nr:GDP-mannose 4,6-dehydratase [Chloroflexota bacterium]
MRVLVTVAAGFAGSHLTEKLLADRDVEVWGTYHHAKPAPDAAPGLHSVECDVRDGAVVRALLADLRPNWIFHMAGQSDVGGSWAMAWQTIEANVRGQLNIFEAMVQASLDAKVLVVGSNNEYGMVGPDDLPIDEDTPLRPDTPYGVSKVAQDLLGLQFYLSHRLHAVRVRSFNYIGPRQSSKFVTAAFARQIAEIEAGLRDPVIHVGNLSAERDFTDVRDMVRAYRLALERGLDGEVYNVGSGRSVPIQRLLDILLGQARRAIAVRPDPARMRPSDVPRSVADVSRFRQATGWEPRIPLEQTLHDILEYWRAYVTPVRAADSRLPVTR